MVAPEFSGGSQSARDKLNAMSVALEALSKIKGDNQFIKVSKTPSGLNISLNAAAVIAMVKHSDSPLRPFAITVVGSDSLLGRYLIPDDAGDLEQGTVDIVALKPWSLRRSPFDGETVDGVTYTYVDAQTREADDGVTQQTEYLTWNYFVGAIIYVSQVNEPGADVIDTNVDGRAWAKGDDLP